MLFFFQKEQEKRQVLQRKGHGEYREVEISSGSMCWHTISANENSRSYSQLFLVYIALSQLWWHWWCFARHCWNCELWIVTCIILVLFLFILHRLFRDCEVRLRRRSDRSKVSQLSKFWILQITEEEFLGEVTGSEKTVVHFFHKEFGRCK